MTKDLILKVHKGLTQTAIGELKNHFNISTINHSNINNLYRYFIPFTKLTKKTIKIITKYHPLELCIPNKEYDKLKNQGCSLEYLPRIRPIK